MRYLVALVLLPLAGFAQQPHEQEIQRAIIELDQRTAEFSRRQSSLPLVPQVGRPLHPDPEIARQLRPYERMKQAQQREHLLRLPPPAPPSRGPDPELLKPLPLPGGPRAGVDAVALPGVGG